MRMRSPWASVWTAPGPSGSVASLIHVPFELPASLTDHDAPSRSNTHWLWLTAGSAAAPVSARSTSTGAPVRIRPRIARSPVSTKSSVGATVGNAGSPAPTMRSQWLRSVPSTSVTGGGAAGVPDSTS